MSGRFTVVAIIAAYNEADIIEQVVVDLIEQGVSVYLLDDGSTDGTVDIVDRYIGRGVLGIERLGATANRPASCFDWERILLRKAQLANELSADWFIHHDADEFRESPWPEMSVTAAIQRVDSLGFNAIDFTCFEFRPDHDRFQPGDDVRKAFAHYAPGPPYNRVQVRCWKRTESRVDLAGSGGHDVSFPGRSVFPIRFILRHYPIRGQAHGMRKVFNERRARFLDRERARGWHVQYDTVAEDASFIQSVSELTRYDPDRVRLSLMLNHRGVEELEQSLNEARSDTVALRETVAALSADLRSNRKDMAEASNRAENEARLAQQQRLHQVRELESLSAELQQRTRELEDFQHSLSWRWTLPARAILRILRGR